MFVVGSAGDAHAAKTCRCAVAWQRCDVDLDGVETRGNQRVARLAFVPPIELPQTETDEERGQKDRDDDEDFDPIPPQRTSKSNVPVSTRCAGFTWTQMR